MYLFASYLSLCIMHHNISSTRSRQDFVSLELLNFPYSYQISSDSSLIFFNRMHINVKKNIFIKISPTSPQRVDIHSPIRSLCELYCNKTRKSICPNKGNLYLSHLSISNNFCTSQLHQTPAEQIVGWDKYKPIPVLLNIASPLFQIKQSSSNYWVKSLLVRKREHIIQVSILLISLIMKNLNEWKLLIRASLPKDSQISYAKKYPFIACETKSGLHEKK